MKTDGGKKGFVLVAILWLKVLLIAMVAISARNSRLDMKVRAVRTEELRCKWAGRAGLEKAVGILNEDTRESDSLLDLWSDNDEDFNDIPLEECRFTVRVIDESSKLNINIATKAQLLELPDMLEEIADAIIDWRDKNDDMSGLGVEGGYYETLTYGYKIRNGPFKTIRELLLVKDVTEDLFYGEDTNFNGQLDYNERDGDQSPPYDDGDSEMELGWIEYLTCYSYATNVDGEGEQRVNINQGNERKLESSLGITQAQAKWIVDNRSYSSIGDLINRNSPEEPRESSRGSSSEPMDMQTFYEISDKITVSNRSKTAGKININTASAIVLAALLGGDDKADQLAEEIVAYREAQMYGMESIAEVMQVSSMDIDTFKKIANDLTIRSDVYTIRSFATAERARGDGLIILTEAVVDRSNTPYETYYWYQGAVN